MDFDETMVDENLDEQTDDTFEESIEEEQDESESLDSLMGSEDEEPADEPEEQAPQATEPGWIKKRVEKAVNKAIAQTRAEMQAMFDQQMAPIRARMIEDEAQELVRSRKVADIETARELVRLRNGQPAVAQAASQPAEQPRQENGQFASKSQEGSDPATAARIDMLRHQAERIEKAGGPDVRKAFMDNEDIKQKVIAGEMDFYDVAEFLKQPNKRPPSPMRSPNGASGKNPNAIDSMSDEQFERMERKIKYEGARYKLR